MVVGWIWYLSLDLPRFEELERFDPDLVTQIVSQDGEVIQELFTTKRELVRSNQIPDYVKRALIVTEDQQFYSHWGMNVFRTLYNGLLLVLTQQIHGGASSITQQLARNLYKRIGFKQTFVRKLRELITAVQLEHTYTKSEILTMYLNTVYFGHGVYGIQAAAQKYFHKDAEDLTLDEGALLIGMLRAPAYYSPLKHPERARHIRNVVLNNMFREGVISAVERNYYRSMPIITAPPDSTEKRELAPYYAEYVRQFMETQEDSLRVNIYRDGLTILTGLDARLQRIAVKAVHDQLEVLQKEFNARLLDTTTNELARVLEGTGYSVDSVRKMIRGEIPLAPDLRSRLVVQGALVALDINTGQIRALVGGRNFVESKFNRATQARRQPGSAFKHFLYTAAIDNGYPVTTRLLNQPVVIKFGDTLDWRPKNYDLSIGGPTTLREGLRRSLNLVAVRVIQELVKPRVVVQYAHRLGLTTPLRAVDALALGTSEVIPLEMAAAYAVFPRLGIWIQPLAVLEVQDRYGGILRKYTPERREVLGRGTSYIMVSLLQTVASQGTGRGMRTRFHFMVPAGGKTGTTQGFTDAWFVGFTTKLSTAVWVGMDSPVVSLGPHQSGARAALPIWAKFMKQAYETLGWEGEEFPVPEEDVIFLDVCNQTFKRATPYCTPIREVFLPGTEPTEYCDIHGRRRPSQRIEF